VILLIIDMMTVMAAIRWGQPSSNYSNLITFFAKNFH